MHVCMCIYTPLATLALFTLTSIVIMSTAVAAAAVATPIFHPVCTSPESVENNLREFIQSGEGDKNIEYVHPYDDTQQCVLKDDRVRWEKLNTPLHLPSLLNENSDLASMENRVLQRLKEYFPHYLKFSSHSVVIQPLPVGQETLQCSVDDSLLQPTPPIFVLSKVVNQNYFDLLAFPIGNNNDRSKPIYFDCENQTTPGFSFEHSGDITERDNLFQHLKINTSSGGTTSGILTAQAYNRKSFIQIAACDPCICLVDYQKENKLINIYVIYFPLTRDFVKQSSICHVCKFDYSRTEKKISWIIPQRPTFDDSSFNVGEAFHRYREKVNIFMESVYRVALKGQQQQKPPPSLYNYPINRYREYETLVDNGKGTVIVQKPLLRIPNRTQILHVFFKNNKYDNFVFHRNIGDLHDDGFDDDNDENNLRYTLPIAGGSIISGVSSVKLGKPIKKLETAQKFVMSLTKKSVRPIVILSNKASSADMPKIHSQLNGVYLLVDLDGERLTPKRLNEITAILPISMQGALSTIFVYSSADEYGCYFYRGVVYNKGRAAAATFGGRFTIEEVLQEAATNLGNIPLKEDKLSHQPVFNIDGQEIFKVSTTFNVHDDHLGLVDDILRNISGDELIVAAQLKFIVAQLEVHLHPESFEKIFEIVSDRVSQMQRISQRECLRLILENHSQIRVCPPRSEFEKLLLTYGRGEGNYSKKWLMQTLANILGIEHRFELVNRYRDTLNDIIDILNNRTKIVKKYAASLLQILNTSVSMRASYGIRNKSLTQVLNRRRINKNLAIIQDLDEEKLDDFIMKHCSDDGVIFLAVNERNLLNSMITNYDQLLNSLTFRFTNFDRTCRNLAGGFLTNELSFPYQPPTEYNNRNMMVFPMLSLLAEAMKAPHKFKWRQIQVDGPIEITRMLLRSVTYKMIPPDMKARHGISSPASPMVASVLIDILFSAIYAMAGSRRDFSGTHEDDAWIQQFRCLMGLIFSIMASGSECPHSLVYQVALHGDSQFSSIKINLVKKRENLWLRQVCKLWSFLKLDHVVDVKSNAIKCVQNRLMDIFKSLIDTDKESGKKEEKRRNIVKMKNARAYFNYNVLSPFVEFCLSFEFPDNEELKNRAKFEDMTKTYYSSNENIIMEEDEGEENTTRMGKINLITSEEKDLKLMFSSKAAAVAASSSVPQVIKDNLPQILEAYDKLAIEHQCNNYFKKSYIFNHAKQLRNNDGDMSKNLNEFYLSIKEFYVRYSLFLIESLMKLEKYLRNCVEGNLSKFKTLMEASNMEMDAKKSKIKMNCSRKRKLQAVKLHPFSIEHANSLKYDILQKLKKYETFNYVYTHKVIKMLIQCKNEDSFLSKDFMDVLSNFIKVKLIEGHFMYGVIMKTSVSEDLVMEKRNRIRELLDITLETDERVRALMNFLIDFNVSKDELIFSAIKELE